MARTRNFGASETVTRRLRYNQEIKKPLVVKIKEAVELLQLCEEKALEASPDGYYLCFSGGKDSCVIKELAKMAGVKFTSHYSVTTIDPPELVRFIKREHKDVIWERKNKIPIPLYMARRGLPPTRMVRWCCEEYKETGGRDRVRILGVRSSESAGRKSRWLPISMRKNDHTICVCPIVYWTEEDVWAFIKAQGVAYCSLYDEGFSRLGCIGCPLASYEQIQKEFAKWPGYQRLWERGFKKMFKEFKNKPRLDGSPRKLFLDKDNWKDMWDWWMSKTRMKKITIKCQQKMV